MRSIIKGSLAGVAVATALALGAVGATTPADAAMRMGGGTAASRRRLHGGGFHGGGFHGGGFHHGFGGRGFAGGYGSWTLWLWWLRLGRLSLLRRLLRLLRFNPFGC